MRIKFLSVIVSFLIVSFALSSCLDSDDNYEFSSDATIHAFGIDTIHGKHYKFTIDQLNRLIYNRDSLPVGSDTIIDRILIDTMTVTGWITSGSPTDTVFVMSDRGFETRHEQRCRHAVQSTCRRRCYSPRI